MHMNTEPPILYFGTPVVLISTLNEDESHNLAPISSVFWLGWRCMIGLIAFSKTAQNMIRTGECVINLPSVSEVAAVYRLALTTGSNPVPVFKARMGYQYTADKFGIAGLTRLTSETVAPPRVQECPVQLEGGVVTKHGVGGDSPAHRGFILCFETRIQRVQADDSIMMDGENNRIDPDKRRLLIMSFQQLYGLGDRLQHSSLGTIPESTYRNPDMEMSRHPHR